ncbi:MAG: hypothetical protein AAF738_00075 [Bacteroidota bacterium]
MPTIQSILFLLFLPLSLFTQTYLGLTISKEFTSVEQLPITLGNYYEGPGWVEYCEGCGMTKVPFRGGIFLQQYLSNKWVLDVGSEYRRMESSGYQLMPWAFVHLYTDTVLEHHFRNTLNIRYNFNRGWFVGTGISSIIPLHETHVMENGDVWRDIEGRRIQNLTMRGWQVFGGYTYKNFTLALAYESSQRNNEGTFYASTSRAHIQSLNLSLSYRFQVLKKPLRFSK